MCPGIAFLNERRTEHEADKGCTELLHVANRSFAVLFTYSSALFFETKAVRTANYSTQFL